MSVRFVVRQTPSICILDLSFAAGLSSFISLEVVMSVRFVVRETPSIGIFHVHLQSGYLLCFVLKSVYVSCISLDYLSSFLLVLLHCLLLNIFC